MPSINQSINHKFLHALFSQVWESQRFQIAKATVNVVQCHSMVSFDRLLYGIPQVLQCNYDILLHIYQNQERPPDHEHINLGGGSGLSVIIGINPLLPT